MAIPLDTPHPRLDVLAETGVRASSPTPTSRSRGTSSSRSSTWTGRAAATPTSRRSPPPTDELDCRGFWDKGKTDKDALWTSNAAIAPDAARLRRRRRRQLRPRAGHQARAAGPRARRSARIHRDDNNRFNPDDEGWIVRSWLELTDNPDSYMLLMDNGPDGLPDPATEERVPAAPGLAVRRRHAAPVARRRPPGRRAALRADHQLRERPDARALDRLASSPPASDPQDSPDAGRLAATTGRRRGASRSARRCRA